MQIAGNVAHTVNFMQGAITIVMALALGEALKAFVVSHNDRPLQWERLPVLLAFLFLAAQYNSWSLPFAVLLIAPMALLSAIAGVWLSGGDNNIFTQIGFVVLIGLAAKNAILIVEFARAKESEGADPLAAVLEAARLRLRPILMTSFAFIAGVVPLVLASGAGAEMRHAMGIAVFAGMLGVTVFGLVLTPVFYVVVRKLALRREARHARGGMTDQHA